MKILLRPRLCGHALAARLAADPQLAKALGAEPNAAVGFVFKKFFDSTGPLLAQVLAHAQAVGERMSFLQGLQFSAAEVAAASHLEVVCRKTIAQSNAESRATLDDYDADSLHPTGGRWQVRMPKRMFLSKAVPAETIPGNFGSSARKGKSKGVGRRRAAWSDCRSRSILLVH